MDESSDGLMDTRVATGSPQRCFQGRLDAHRHGACKTVEQVRSLQERPGILEDLDESGPRPAFGPGKKSHVTRALASWNRHASWVAPNLQRFGSKRKDRCDGQRCLGVLQRSTRWTTVVA